MRKLLLRGRVRVSDLLLVREQLEDTLEASGKLKTHLKPAVNFETLKAEKFERLDLGNPTSAMCHNRQS